MSGNPPPLHSNPFRMAGELGMLVKGMSVNDEWKPSRPLGGWLCTYAKLGPNGGIIPTKDRDEHIFDAAQTLGRIDFSDYLRKGIWNDTHNIDPDSPKGKPRKLPESERVYVGVPTLLEFHDQESPLAKAHRKLGFWTEGHLFDRDDPRSWTDFSDRVPTAADLERSDYFWQLATLLKGTPRPLGISADGKMLLSPCKKRIIWAKVDEAAICEIPVNPYATIEPLMLARPVTPDMVAADACDTCSCPAGACHNLLRKGLSGARGSVLSTAEMRSIPNGDLARHKDTHLSAKLGRVIALLQEDGLSREQALRWVHDWMKIRPSRSNHDGTGAQHHG
jgi:hypothetical protein